MTDPQRRALRFLVKQGGLWEVNPYARPSTLLAPALKDYVNVEKRVDPATGIESRYFTANDAGRQLVASWPEPQRAER